MTISLGRTLVTALVAIAGAALAFAVQATTAGAQTCSDYTCADYLEHDLDNYTRARGRQITETTSPDYHSAFMSACADSSTGALGGQLSDIDEGRVYGGVGQATCWWSVGDAPAYFEVSQRRVHFLSRTGAKLQGHVWGAEAPGPRPGVVITTGSIQASDQMYWWAARALARAGYVVLTFDVQGQGQSETFGHDPGSIFPTPEGVPSQQAANFHDGTIDALRFFLSTPQDPYRPTGWSAEDVAAAKAAADSEHLEWTNPGWGALDRDRLGIAGHSLGAGAVSAVQQCSDQAELWKTLPLCSGRSFPIRAVLAWDALSGSGVTPVVPAMSQQADGYFLFPTLSSTAPDPNSSLAGYNLWETAGLDTFMYVVRGGTHIEWSQVPYTSATTYGAAANAYYTLAWMGRWVPRSGKARKRSYDALLAAPKSEPAYPWAANYFSTRRYSAMTLRAPGKEGGAPSIQTDDLRKWAGRSEVGDWAGSNADRWGRVAP
jgi:dienelactone hydrolase